MTMYKADTLPRTRVTDSMSSGLDESQHTVKKNSDKDVQVEVSQTSEGRDA